VKLPVTGPPPGGIVVPAGGLVNSNFSRDFPKPFITFSQVRGILDSKQALVNGQVQEQTYELLDIGG
jgi:hypothetical protein